MMEEILKNKVMIIVLAVLLAGTTWYMLRDAAPADQLVTENFAESGSPVQAERDIVATLLQLRTVSLDGTVFINPAFRALQDFGSEIVTEPVGRENPFAPTNMATSTATVVTPTSVRQR
jgi:hypothetical protein